MSSFGSVNDRLANFLATQKPAEVPVEEPSNSVTSTEEPSKVEPQEAPKEPQVEVQQVVEEKVEPIESTSWDADSEVETSTKEESPKIDFSKLGSALELGEIKDESEFVSKVSELKSLNKKLQEKPLEGIPEEFREVIEVAKTGDWKEYLSNQIVDYTKLDPLKEFEEDFYTRFGSRFMVDGKFNLEAYEAALDAIPEVQQELVGRQILDAKHAHQQRAKMEMKQKAEAKRSQAEQQLSKAAQNLSELLPFESYGIKFEGKHKSEIQKGISNSELLKKHLGSDYDTLVRAGFDMTKLTRTIAAAEYAEKMVKFKGDKSKIEAKKEILQSTQNVQLNSPGSHVTPEEVKKKVLTPEELMKHYVNNQRKNGL